MFGKKADATVDETIKLALYLGLIVAGSIAIILIFRFVTHS